MGEFVVAPGKANESEIDVVVFVYGHVGEAAEKVVPVTLSDYCFLNLVSICGCDPPVVDDQHGFAAWIWCLWGDGVVCAGMFGKVIHVNLGVLMDGKSFIGGFVIGVTLHPYKSGRCAGV